MGEMPVIDLDEHWRKVERLRREQYDEARRREGVAVVFGLMGMAEAIRWRASGTCEACAGSGRDWPLAPVCAYCAGTGEPTPQGGEES